MPRRPIHYSLRKAAIYDCHRAFEAMRNAGISPIDEVLCATRTVKRMEKIHCAMMEAGRMMGREYEISAILNFVENKYGQFVENIRSIVGKYLTDMVTEGENFGFFTPYEKEEAKRICRVIFEKDKKEEENDAV
jgi:hypothetical protein